MDFELSEEQQMLRQTVRDYVRDHVAPVAAQLDETETFPVEPVRKAAELGLFGILFTTLAFGFSQISSVLP